MARRSSSGCFNIMNLFRRKKSEARHDSNNEVEEQLRAEIQELKEKLAEKERCLEETLRDLAILRNRVHLLEDLRPKPGAKETTKKTENQFNEEVVEPPAKFENARAYRQMEYEQPMFQFLPTEEMYEYETWPAGTWVPIPQRDSQFNENIAGSSSEVLEPPPQFDYSRGYGQIHYEQPMFQFLTLSVF